VDKNKKYLNYHKNSRAALIAAFFSYETRLIGGIIVANNLQRKKSKFEKLA
jgi:hypothetical protein